MKAFSIRRLYYIAAILLILFLTLALILSVPSPLYNGVIRFDHAVNAAFQPLRALDFFSGVMLGITYLGNPEIIIALEICLIVFILLAHRKKVAFLFLGGILAAEAVSITFKDLLERVRPEETVFHISRVGYSYPSGHALIGSVFYGCLGLFAAHLTPKVWQKRLIAVISGIIIFSIGFSRVYLGVHWASDVIGGWLLGIATVCIVTALFYTIHKHTKGETFRTVSRGEWRTILTVMVMALIYIVYFFVTHLSELRSIL